MQQKTQNFDAGINLKMIQVLEQKSTAGVFLFGLVTIDGELNPVLILSEHIVDKEEFVRGFFNLMSRHGLTINAK